MPRVVAVGLCIIIAPPVRPEARPSGDRYAPRASQHLDVYLVRYCLVQGKYLLGVWAAGRVRGRVKAGRRGAGSRTGRREGQMGQRQGG